MSQRPHASRLRIATAGAIAALGATLVACHAGQSNDSAADAAVAGASPAGNATRTLAWSPASGPVAGYRVWVARSGGVFNAEVDVPSAGVTLRGEPGETARVVVAAFDGQGNVGVMSPPSAPFKFPDPEAGTAAAPASSTSSAAPSRSLAAASSTSAAAPSDPSSALVAPSDKTAWDMSGDLAAGLLWEAGGALRVTTAALDTELVFSRPEADDEVAALGDFDGDGLADPLWVGADGGVGYTPMAALRADASTTPVVALGTLASDEGVVAAGDFDGDGLADVMVRDATDGFTSLWLSNPDAAPDVAGLGAIADAVAGVADYDGDGTDDILWRTSQGSLVVWQMAGALAHGVVEVPLPASAELVASGDFDGDGAADVAHRDPATGVVSILRPVVGAPDGGATALGDTRGWSPAGAADFDGDGSADLLLSASDALRFAYLPGEDVRALDPASPWSLVPLPR